LNGKSETIINKVRQLVKIPDIELFKAQLDCMSQLYDIQEVWGLIKKKLNQIH